MSNWIWVISYEEQSNYSGLENEICTEIKDQIAVIISRSSSYKAALEGA